MYLGFRKTFIDIIRIDIANGLGDVSADLLNSPIHSGVIKANIFRDHGAVSTLVGNIVLTKFGLTNWKKQQKENIVLTRLVCDVILHVLYLTETKLMHDSNMND